MSANKKNYFKFSLALTLCLLVRLIPLRTPNVEPVLAYGILGLWSASYFKKTKENSANKWGYVRFAIIGTLLYDALTGLTIGPIFFHQSFFGSLVGQIPFTLLHLLGNIAFAFILSPAIYNFMIKKRRKKTEKEKLPLENILYPKTI